MSGKAISVCSVRPNQTLQMSPFAHHTTATLEARTTNSLFWSPRGRQIVLATTGSVNRPEIDFYDTDFYADDRREGTVFTNNVEDFSGGVVCMKTGEHYGITNIDWDPSGRYVVTSSSIWKQSVCTVTQNKSARLMRLSLSLDM